MLSTITSGAIRGITSYLVSVETDISQGMPCFDMVGYLAGEVREAKERVRVALRNMGIALPAMRITVNLSPADVRKDGTAFDLPIAVGILTSLGVLTPEQTEGIVIAGELGLGGEIKPVKGILPIVMEAKKNGFAHCIVPYENAAEGAVVQGIAVTGVTGLKELLHYLKTDTGKRSEVIQPYLVDREALFRERADDGAADFADVSGQESAKRAAEIAAAGFHHLLLIGPPGCGKTMIAKRIPSILPPLTMEESLEVSKIYSVSGMLDTTQSLITKRPFLNPHHTISIQALAGGGRIPRPGVMSLAHRGILFLDELPEFGRNTLDLMRQPLEDKVIQIARNQGTYTYPADFMLVCAMNPCPCGYYPDMGKCRCTPHEVKRYLNRVSGPLLDRIDLCVDVERTEPDLFAGAAHAESSASMRERVMAARDIQKKRYAGTGIFSNAGLTPGQITKYCPLGQQEAAYLKELCHAMQLSARAYQRVLKVARTIADVEGSERILDIHISEAVCYRSVDGKYWQNGMEGQGV